MGTLPVVRWAAAVVVGAVLGSAALRVLAPPAVEGPLAVAALAVPSVVLLGEPAIVFGAASVPAGYEGDRHLVVCQADGRCTAGTPGRVAGAGTWHGAAGTLPADGAGRLEVAWVLGVDVGLDGGRTVAVAHGASEVRAEVGGIDAPP